MALPPHHQSLLQVLRPSLVHTSTLWLTAKVSDMYMLLEVGHVIPHSVLAGLLDTCTIVLIYILCCHTIA
jgi:hypothetical protein